MVGGDAYKIMSLSRRLPGKTMPVGVSLIIDHLSGLVAVALLFALGLAFVQLYRTSETVLTVARGTLYMLVLVGGKLITL